jgi:hypothetical protein
MLGTPSFSQGDLKTRPGFNFGDKPRISEAEGVKGPF